MPDKQWTMALLTIVGTALVAVFVFSQALWLMSRWRRRSWAIAELPESQTDEAPAPVEVTNGHRLSLWDQGSMDGGAELSDINLPGESAELVPTANEAGDDPDLVDFRQRMTQLGRNVEHRISNRLELLDELVGEADREIVTLSELLEDMRPGVEQAETDDQRETDVEWLSLSANRPAFDTRQRAMIVCLAESGFAAFEIACLAGCRESDVVAVLRSSEDRAA